MKGKLFGRDHGIGVRRWSPGKRSPRSPERRPAGKISQGIVDVLFNQEDGGSFLVDPVDDLEDHADKKGGQSQRRFVEHQDFGQRHQPPSFRYTRIHKFKAELERRVPPRGLRVSRNKL